jgi:molybdopterin-guanine dinucleotide biosynthesis protein A
MLYGAVLAGGQSRRMGQDKAVMQYKGCTLIQRASEILTSAGCQQVLVSRNEPSFTNDLISNVGPLGGVHAILHSIIENHQSDSAEILVLPVDMPLMSPSFLRAMVSYGRANKRACYVKSRFLPFYIPMEDSLIATLENYLTVQNKRRVVGFLESVNGLVYEDMCADNANDSLWLNVNSPGDWPNENGTV